MGTTTIRAPATDSSTVAMVTRMRWNAPRATPTTRGVRMGEHPSMNQPSQSLPSPSPCPPSPNPCILNPTLQAFDLCLHNYISACLWDGVSRCSPEHFSDDCPTSPYLPSNMPNSFEGWLLTGVISASYALGDPSFSSARDRVGKICLLVFVVGCVAL